jgi:hypothetical protein
MARSSLDISLELTLNSVLHADLDFCFPMLSTY